MADFEADANLSRWSSKLLIFRRIKYHVPMIILEVEEFQNNTATTMNPSSTTTPTTTPCRTSHSEKVRCWKCYSILAVSGKELGIALGLGLGLGIPVLLVGLVLGGYYWVKSRRKDTYRTVTRAPSRHNVYPDTYGTYEDDFVAIEFF